MKICQVTQAEFKEWLDLALELWPDYSDVEMEVSLLDLLHSDRESGILVRDDNGKAIAFMNLSLRSDYVPGANHRPVAYLEGVYVKPEYRKQGVGKALIEYAERWALDRGCTELASDALIDNTTSHEFHEKIGFQEVERTVFFIKSITREKT
jgi:aminoglycoside 6'-N-acetyltransferase I